MTMSKRRLALLFGALVLALGAVQSAIWHGSEGLPWIAALAEQLWPGSPGASGLDLPPSRYFEWGRGVWLVYALLACLPGRERKLEDGALRGLLGLAWLSDLCTYGFSRALGPVFRAQAFWGLEVPALLAVFVLLTGVAVRDPDPSPARRFGRLLPVWLLLSMGSIAYLPHGLLAPIAVQMVLRSRGKLRFGLGATTLGLAVCGAILLALPYRPIPVAGPAVEFGEERPDPHSNLRLHVFDTGENRMSSSLVANPIARPVPAFLIEHPELGSLAFDLGQPSALADGGRTGLPDALLLSACSRPELRLDRQWKEAGLAAPSRVVLSHLHHDHWGTLLHVPSSVPVMVGPSASPPLGRPSWVFAPNGSVAGLPSMDLAGDGSLQVVAAGGHTPEDLMLLAALPEGPVLLTGDAVVHFEWLEGEDVERLASDPARAARVRNIVRAMQAAWPELVVVPGHDLSRLPQRPDILRYPATGRASSECL